MSSLPGFQEVVTELPKGSSPSRAAPNSSVVSSSRDTLITPNCNQLGKTALLSDWELNFLGSSLLPGLISSQTFIKVMNDPGGQMKDKLTTGEAGWSHSELWQRFPKA